MAILKCKMCGADLAPEEGASVCECEYCGTKQTLPNMDDEKRLKLFDRANRLRMNAEFDKASSVYESIVADYDTDAEAYWGLVLCKYGIEYVDDPATGDKVPTCHRSSFDSVMHDSDFELVMENADSISRQVYREQAKQIEEIRKGIIEVSGKEQPYDIFICYKETDENGNRTIDSVLAQDIYDRLIAKGYRVFFSRITLEDKLGTEYEPYIFAALNSAKVMLAFGTSYDYYNAVWVKNEWSRFLKLMAKDKEKHLIPCYKDIDAYDMPQEFARLQAQDLGKVGADQDLVRGIDKLLGKDAANAEKNQPVIQQVVSGGPNAEALVSRGYDSLEDGEIEEAKTYFNDALNSNAHSAEAYLGLFMADISAKDKETAKKSFVEGNYTDNRYWKRAVQYAEGEFANTLNSWNEERDARLRRETEEELIRWQKLQEEWKKKEEEIASLKEQLQSENFELSEEQKAESERLNNIRKEKEAAAENAERALDNCAEKQQIAALNRQINEKEAQIRSLGIFKGKEKKALQEEIVVLKGKLTQTEHDLNGKIAAAELLKKQSLEAQAAEKQFIQKAKAENKSNLQKQILSLFGINLDLINRTAEFGAYKGTTIKWKILEQQNNRVLMISENLIDKKAYNEKIEDITWENSTIRKWLNSSFISSAFSTVERSLIAKTNVTNPNNPKYGTIGGNNTSDQIFLLSIEEVNQYFSSNTDRIASYVGETSGSWWWLRSPGSDSNHAAYVYIDGSVNSYGNYVNYTAGIRPALWIDISNLE